MRLTDRFLALPLQALLLLIIVLSRDTLRATFGPEVRVLWLGCSLSVSRAGCKRST